MKDQDDHSKNSGNPQGKSVFSHPSLKRIHFEEIDSTNTWAKRNPQEWTDEGMTLVTASSQTAGRGRFNRIWMSPPHMNLYATFCFWMERERRDIGHIPQLLALACAKVLVGFSPKIKWPNDLLLGGKKVAGILCETIQEEKGLGMICGIGLNVNMPQELLLSLNRPATSLWIEAGRKFDREEILQELTRVFEEVLNHFKEKGFSPFFSSFQELFFFKPGQRVCFHWQEQLWEGWFEKLHADGSIELRLNEGNRRRFYAGEFMDMGD